MGTEKAQAFPLERQKLGQGFQSNTLKPVVQEYGEKTSYVTTRPSLRRNFLWAMIGDGVYAGCQWGLLIITAKLGNAAMVGQFALGLAITAPVIIFCGLSLRAIQATDAKSEYEFGDYLALRLTTTLCALAMIPVVTLIAQYRRETTLVILWIGLAKGIETISEIYYSLLQRHERMDLIATSLMIKGPLSLVALPVGLSITGSRVGGGVGMAAAAASVVL
jgi:O-antigen/teichoic acid export membrane protein